MNNGFLDQKEMYRQGNKDQAFQMFLEDPTANPGVSFDRFCEYMDRVIREEMENKQAYASLITD